MFIIKKILVFAMIFIGVMPLMGCVSADKLRNDAQQLRAVEAIKKTPESRAKIIADYLLKIDEIEDCAVHVSGRTAVIGISLATDLERRELVALKRKIAAEAKNADPQTTHATVSTSASIYKKLDAMRRGEREHEEEKELEENGKNAPVIVVPSF